MVVTETGMDLEMAAMEDRVTTTFPESDTMMIWVPVEVTRRTLAN